MGGNTGKVDDPEVDEFYGVGSGAVCSSSDVVIIGKDGKPQKPAAPVAGCEPVESSLKPEDFRSSWKKTEEPDHCKVLGLDLGAGCGKSFKEVAAGIVDEIKTGKPGPATFGVVGAAMGVSPETRGILGNVVGAETSPNNVFEFSFSR